MALNKVPYVDGVTVITAENLNDIQDAIIALENAPAQGLTEDMKQALLQIARKVAYIDDQGQTYYDDLYDAFYPPKTVVLITAVFNQGSTVIYDETALDDLKQYLTVTAKYDDNTTAILPDNAYSLSGLLEAPSSTVTVLYNGVSTTFSVAVTARPTLSSITAVYTQSGTVYDTDTLDSLKADLVVTAHYSDSSTQTVPAADYTLSGTLTAGTSTITVSYGGKTTTFNVTVTESALYHLTNGTHTFSDGSVITVTNGNHIKYECEQVLSSAGSTNPFFSVVDVTSLGQYNDNSQNMSDSTWHQPTFFTMPSGATVVYSIKNVSALAGSYNIQSNIRIATNQGPTVFTTLSATSSSGTTATKTLTSSTPVGAIYFFFNTCQKTTYEFDIEIRVDGVKYI